MNPESSSITPLDARIIVEGEHHSGDSWKERLGCTDTEIQNLIDLNIFRKIGSKIRNDFVGIIELRSKSFFSLPKIFDFDDSYCEQTDLNNIFHCLQQYRRRGTEKNIERLDLIDHNAAESRRVIFLKLVDWTRNYGLHSAKTELMSSDILDVDWGDTIDKATIMHFRTGAVFSSYFGRYQGSLPLDLANAQVAALLSLYDELGAVGRIWLSTVDPIMEVARAHKSSSSYSDLQIRESILRARDLATRDHDIALVDILVAWLRLSDVQIGDSISIFGLNAFHTVWEDMCSVALGSKSGSRHSEIASQPQYLLSGQVKALSPQRPDLLHEFTSGLILADAKWYRVWRGDVPHTPDVIKQIMYEMSIVTETQIGNIFVVPYWSETKTISDLGSVEMVFDKKPDNRFGRISIIGLDWKTAVNTYLHYQTREDLIELVKDLALGTQ